MVPVCGGPYADKPEGFYGVKMAAEIDRPCEVDVPTVDFQVPDVKTLKAGLLKAYRALQKGKPVYVGCMGGIGRTGLFLACLAKVSGIADPVKFVRAHYYGHAVETAEQKALVKAIDVRGIRRAVRKKAS
jgi:protein-tyrosine phosphatase